MQRGELGLELVVLPQEAVDLVLGLEPLRLALQRRRGQRARKLALGGVDQPAHIDRLPRVGLQLEILPEVVDRRDRVLDVPQEDQPRLDVRLGRALVAARDHLEVGVERLLVAPLLRQLLALAVLGLVGLGGQRQALAPLTARGQQQREERPEGWNVQGFSHLGP
ncbi:MAG: hypothetical protein NT173_15140 [Opitutales bacterium]|nr:hypothetical protein [Opitutales bacterium]